MFEVGLLRQGREGPAMSERKIVSYIAGRYDAVATFHPPVLRSSPPLTLMSNFLPVD